MQHVSCDAGNDGRRPAQAGDYHAHAGTEAIPSKHDHNYYLSRRNCDDQGRTFRHSYVACYHWRWLNRIWRLAVSERSVTLALDRRGASEPDPQLWYWPNGVFRPAPC